jgi:hypothetical protein
MPDAQRFRCNKRMLHFVSRLVTKLNLKVYIPASLSCRNASVDLFVESHRSRKFLKSYRIGTKEQILSIDVVTDLDKEFEAVMK